MVSVYTYRENALVAVGGICVTEPHLKDLEADLEFLCAVTGFVRTEEFKWSSGRERWMCTNLRDQARAAFFVQAFAIAARHEVSCPLISTKAEYREPDVAIVCDGLVVILYPIGREYIAVALILAVSAAVTSKRRRPHGASVDPRESAPLDIRQD